MSLLKSKLMLRLWVGLISVIALVNAVQCFLHDRYPQERIYTLQPEQATPLLSRMFGVWTFLAAAVRLGFAVFPDNKSIYLAALSSFVLAFFHFVTEVFVYETAPLSFSTLLPLAISSLSAIWMISAYQK